MTLIIRLMPGRSAGIGLGTDRIRYDLAFSLRERDDGHPGAR